MNLFSKFAFLSFCLIGFFSATAQVLSPDPELIVKIDKKEIVVENGKRYLLVPIEIQNNSSEKLNYRSWSCSWENYFSINKMDLQIVPSFCDKNYPITISLATNEIKKGTLKLKISPGFKGEVKFRIAMDLIKVVENEPFSDSGELFWSNEITLQVP